MADDLRLLFDAVFLQLPAGLEAVIIAAPRVAMENQIPFAEHLSLPDVGHFVNKQALQLDRSNAEIIAIGVTQRMKVDMAARGHGYCAPLKWKPLAAFYRDRRIIDCIAEHGTCKGDLAHAERALPTNWAGGALS